MNVVVIGSGGREHALAWRIIQSKSLENLYCIPGNPGTDAISENVSMDISNHNEVINFCSGNSIDLVVIGPEQPLVDGLSDSLRKAGFNVFGPDSSAAMIEASKSFAKEIMLKASVPTAGYIEFSSNRFDEALKFLSESKFPVVIKADGLAAGKGVFVCENFKHAQESLNNIFIDKVFGESGTKIIIEDFLDGEEASIFAVTDGEDFILLPPSQDHKRIGNGDTGKNTGGMGAYAPAPIVSTELLNFVSEKVIRPTLTQLRSEQKKFIGCLYAGLMINDNDVKVVEFNCRFGDPETQAVLPLIKGDFLRLLYSAASGKLDKSCIEISNSAAVCIVAASKGYPDSYEKGYPIKGLEISAPDTIVFHAGTNQKDDMIYTNGGRVVGVTSVSASGDLKEAQLKAYSALEKIFFNGIYYRKDIAEKAFRHK